MFAALIRRFSLPLLAKDLVETANRRRTYVLRVIYALLLYFFSFLFYVEETNALSQSGIDLLGTGKNVLLPAVLLQFVGICLFMPALSTGAITVEKERNTLTLLFLTRLGPWTILFEKYLARVVNMLGYLLISLPLLGLAYSLGGISQIEIWAGIGSLFLMAAQVGAISVACSAFFHSTTAAFIWTYILGTILYFFPQILLGGVGYQVSYQAFSWLEIVINGMANQIHQIIVPWFLSAASVLGVDPLELQGSMRFVPIQLANNSDRELWTCPLNLFVGTAGPGIAYWHLLVRSLPILATIAINLLLARYWLVRRAVATGGSKVMATLRWVDQFFHRLNQNRFTKGRVLIQDSQQLPVGEPIEWRETRKRAFGTVRYLVRCLLLIEFPTAFFCILVITLSVNHSGYNNRSETLAILSMILWVLVTLFLISKAATVLPSERLRETFDVLLSTPISTREIIRQKYAGVRRLIWILTIPLLTVILAHIAFIETSKRPWWDSQGLGWYFIGMVGATLIYPRMIAWLSMLIGLLVKSQTKAIFITLAIMLAWIVVPIVCLFIWDEIMDMPLRIGNPLATIAFSQSPAFLIVLTETGEERNAIILTIVVSLIQYGAITVCLREICLGAAAHLLGRPETR